MKTFVDFYAPSTGWNGRDYSGPKTLIRALGSDGYCPLDGRLGLPELHRAAREKLAGLQKSVRPYYAGYQLMRGEIRNAVPLSGIVECAPRPAGN